MSHDPPRRKERPAGSRLRLAIALIYFFATALLFAIWLESRQPLVLPSWLRTPYSRTDEGVFRYLVQRLLRTPSPTDEVMVVSFDWRATKIYGPLPFPRDVYGELVEKLRRQPPQGSPSPCPTPLASRSRPHLHPDDGAAIGPRC